MLKIICFIYYVCRYDTGAIYDGNAFEITNWSEVDLFCYFSHNFITIPPQSWVRACRRHKVRVIGTFITEWDAGRCIIHAMICRPLVIISGNLFLQE